MSAPYLVDSHCHLNYEQLEDTAAVVQRANEAGVKVLQTICTKMSEADEVKQIANDYAHVYASVGVHPHEAANDITSVEALVAAAQDPKVIGIGETGLDFYYENSPREEQEVSFRKHIEAARQLDLPVIVHSRSADEDTVRIIEDELQNGQFKFLIHCFSSAKYLADKSVELGGYISLSGILTFKKSDELRDIAKSVPLDRLLVETDAPYLAPVPHRGKPCEPAYTRLTAECLAEVKNLSYEAIAAATTDNFFRLFTKATRPENL